jgi:hypothetical protein
MASGRVEIAYTGIQDTFLTGAPQFTYFQKVYKQHTKFAMEVMDTPIDGTLNFGQNLVATIPRMGDMIRTIYLRVLLSNVSYTFIHFFSQLQLFGMKCKNKMNIWLDSNNYLKSIIDNLN